MKSIRILISGRVQGVNFRRFAKISAERLGIRGYVKNLSDERVEVVCQGSADRMREFIKECRKGPPSSYVEDVFIEEIDFDGLTGFEIRY